MIKKRDGATIPAKVMRVGTADISYKMKGGQDTTLFSLSLSELRSITYENGVTDTFNAPEAHMYRGNYYSSMDLAERGKLDAKMYYKGYRGAKTGTAISSIYPFYGIIPALICSNTQPRYESLGYPFPELMEKDAYRSSYERTAFRIKKRQVWNDFSLAPVLRPALLLSL
jgi:hypothetical protein